LISRLFFATAFLLGAAAIAAMGLTFIASDPLGLVVTVVIGGVYGIGFIEILQFSASDVDALECAVGIVRDDAGSGSWLS
jgi:hypothetical protein